MERSKAGTKNEVPCRGLNYSSGLSSPGSLRPETVDEFPNLSMPIVHPLPPGRGDNINKHNMVIFYKTWEKRNEIQLTKKLNGLEQIENEKHKSLARARA